MNLDGRLKTLPDKPGVYIMKGKSGEILYVGKAVSLRNRVRSYFHSSKNQPRKVQAMMEKVADFEYVVTDSEIEALILECNLIKKHVPWYNVRLRDDKTYPYVRITVHDKFPRVFSTRELVDDGSRYFGPYTNASALYDTLRWLKRLFPVRSCNKKMDEVDSGTGDGANGGIRNRPCLNYHIRRCLAPCAGKVTEEAYRELVDKITLFLEGRQEELVRAMYAKMQESAERMEYEKAAAIRDQIRAMESVVEKQKIVSPAGKDQDIIGFARNESKACVLVFLVRGGKLIGKEQFMLESVDGVDNEEMLTAFVKQYYAGATFIPEEIILQDEIDDRDVITRWLRERKGSKITVVVPKRGEKKRLVDMVQKNALLALKEIQEETHEEIHEETYAADPALAELQSYLSLQGPVRWIEAFDISNIHGDMAVGSMVVFRDGRPSKSEYRRFKIKTVQGPDDYAMMQEVMERRYRRLLEKIGEEPGEEPAGLSGLVPDLILVDGGKGQLGAARKVLAGLNLGRIPTVGLAKEFEHLFIEGRRDPIVLPRRSRALFLVKRIRDEAHRFAVTYHRNLRGKKSLESVLSGIPGIGKERRKALLMRFATIDDLKSASAEEIASVPGMNRKAAIKLREILG